MTKTVFITGASSGFGKETAKLFQNEGWNVIATMRSPEKETELPHLKNVLLLKLDVTDKLSIDEAIKKGIEKFGNIDVLVNNAGYGVIGIFESSSSEQIKKQFDVNVFGLMEVTKAVLPHLRNNGGGMIINISSFGGLIALPMGSLYISTKFAVEGFSESLSHEVINQNILVKLIEPGGVATNFGSSVDFIKNEITSYDSLTSTFFQRHVKHTENFKKATPGDVAKIIYEAATDGKLQLRYVVGDDAQFLIDTKMKNNESDFIKQMRDALIN